MNNNTITTNKSEFTDFVYNEVQKMRHILFDLCTEDYLCMPETKICLRKGKKVVIISMKEWERYKEDLGIYLGDLLEAREAIEKMKPVYMEYHEEYEKKHNISLDDYIKHIVVSYNFDEFEAVRDRFEEDFYKRFDDER